MALRSGNSLVLPKFQALMCVAIAHKTTAIHDSQPKTISANGMIYEELLLSPLLFVLEIFFFIAKTI